MGNLLTIMVNSIMQEITKKIKDSGYHSYNIDLENNFTVEGIRNNPKCKLVAKKTTVTAEELFVLDNVCMDASSRLCIDINIPKILLKIGKAGFTCSDPKFSCAVTGWVQIIDIRFSVIVSVAMINGLKLDQFMIKPKITEIKSDIQLVVNKKDCSEMANNVLRSQDPAFLNFILDFILKSQEESIKKFVNDQLQEGQTCASFD